MQADYLQVVDSTRTPREHKDWPDHLALHRKSLELLRRAKCQPQLMSCEAAALQTHIEELEEYINITEQMTSMPRNNVVQMVASSDGKVRFATDRD